MRARLKGALAGAGLVLATAGTAHAQIAQSWVSGVGDDENPCSRTAPCRTFDGAIAKTTAQGVLNVLDPGAYGPVTITKSLTISGGASGVQLVATGNAITVAAGADDRVLVRNLALDGDGTGTGISFHTGRSVLVENVSITGFARAIDATHAVGGGLFLTDVRATGNGAGLHAEGLGGPLLASITGSAFDRNTTAVEALGGARLTFLASSLSGNATAVDATTSSDVNLEHVELANNATAIDVHGQGLVRASAVVATGNGSTTLTENGGTVLSFGSNRTESLSTIALVSSTLTAGAVAGTKITYPVDATVTGFLASAVAFSCTGLPVGARCAATELAGGTGSGQVALTVTTTAAKSAFHASSSSNLAFGGLFFLPLLLGLGRRRKWRVEPLLFAGLVCAAGITACADEDQNNDPETFPDIRKDGGAVSEGVTPPGSYPFKVVATSGQTAASLDLTLVVQ